MHVRLHVIVAVVFAAMFLSACNGSSTPPPAPPFVSAQQPVPAVLGGALTLANGDAVAVPPGVLGTDQLMTIASDATETPAIPNPGWKAAPGTMTVNFGGALARSKTGGNIKFTFAFATSAKTQILAAQAPMLEVTTVKGTVERVSPDATFDATKNVMTVDVPIAFIAGATSVKLYAAVDGPPLRTPSFGPRFWNTASTPPQWIPEPFTVDPSKSTVVMVHGIFSSVETAFGPCEGGIISAGGFGQAVGLDYDWTQPPATEAPLLANFINSLPVSTVDIEAHSYGTVVALAALPLITKKIGHVVLLGGPLPLNGSPQADPGYLRDLVLLGIFAGGYPSDVYRAVSSGMVGSLATDSAAMQTINTEVRALNPFPPFVQVAGQHALPAETSNDFVYALYLSLYGFSNNDGVVEESSALTNFPTSDTFVALNLDHIQLECSSLVINWVGSQINP